MGDDFQLPTCPAFFNIFHPVSGKIFSAFFVFFSWRVFFEGFFALCDSLKGSGFIGGVVCCGGVDCEAIKLFSSYSHTSTHFSSHPYTTTTVRQSSLPHGAPHHFVLPSTTRPHSPPQGQEEDAPGFDHCFFSPLHSSVFIKLSLSLSIFIHNYQWIIII